MYVILPKNRTVENNFDSLVGSLEDVDKTKLMTTLAKYPKSIPREMRTETVGRVEKRGNFWQYYAPDARRVIYDVKDRPKQVIVQFAGDHEEAQIWLRNNARR